MSARAEGARKPKDGDAELPANGRAPLSNRSETRLRAWGANRFFTTSSLRVSGEQRYLPAQNAVKAALGPGRSAP